MSKDLSPDHEVAAGIEDPFLRRSVKTALHLRRYMPFYVFGLVWIVTLALFPSIRNNDDATTGVSAGTDVATGADAGVDVPDPDSTVGTLLPDGTTTGTGTAGTGGGTAKKAGATTNKVTAPVGGGGSAPISATQAASAIQRGTGTARGGFACTPGAGQIPGSASAYDIPCQAAYNGPNGGATARGVTDKEITIVRRKFPESANSQAVAAVSESAGFASSDEVEEARLAFIDYFNKTYELYGRKLKYVIYESENGNSTDEAQSKGKEGACLDAEKVAKEIKAFGVFGGSSPFGECAAERQMMVYTAGAYFPETWYRKYHPYLWGTVMECERISYQVSEYIGKRLINKKAKWAGDAITQAKTRYFGTYVPDNDGYQSCVAITQRELKNKYGVKDTGPQYNYVLDISRFPDQAASASVQFSTAGVTTVILACDYISAVVLTGAAQKQNWHPEWLLIGVGGTDLDNSARLYDQDQVRGHMFGMSQLGPTQKLIGPNSEPGRVYKQATGKTLPLTDGGYYTLVHTFNLLQSAGPVLTAENVGRGAMTIPASTGAPDYAGGYWSLLDGPDGTPGAGDHTVVDDSREVYWVSEEGTETVSGASANDPYYNGEDGANGTLKEAYGGKRFRNNEWSREDPQAYPPR